MRQATGSSAPRPGQIRPACPTNFENLESTSAMAFLTEFWRFLKARKKVWLLPIMVVMLVLGGLLILAEGSALAPFIYTLF